MNKILSSKLCYVSNSLNSSVKFIALLLLSITASVMQAKAQAPTTQTECTCPGNIVTNPSFESGTNGWTWSGGNFNDGTGAVACGNKSGDFEITNSSNNSVYQVIGTDLAVGTTINAKVYAGTHDNSFTHKVFIRFYDASNVYMSSVSEEVEVDQELGSGPQLYTFSATVPAGAKYTRIGSRGTGSWVKTDMWCVTTTPPSACNAKVNSLYFNKLDGGTDLPIPNGSTFTVAQLGSLYNLEAGTTGTVGSVKYTITGPTPSSNIENTTPYNSPGTGSGAWTGAVGTYNVNLKTYSSADATGTLCHDTTITFNLTNTTFDCNCTGTNVVLNPGFESGTTNWSWSGGTLSQGTGAVACGSFSGDLNNTSASSKAWQTIGTDLLAGTIINASVYAGTHDNTFNNWVAVEFLDASNVVLGTSVYTQVDKILANAPVGPQLYTFSATVPSGAKYTRVAFGGNGSYTKTDRWCVTSTPPVNLQLGNRVWNDINNNGINEATENGMQGVTVELYKDDNNDNVADGAAIANTTTNATGYYLFSNLAAGNYIVGIVMPAGYMSSGINGSDPDNNIDADDNGVNYVGNNEIRGLSITLSGGTEPTNNGNENLTYDFGLYLYNVVNNCVSIATTSGGTRVEFLGVTYSGTSPNITTKYTYKVTSGCSPNVSHFDFGNLTCISCFDDASDFAAVTGSPYSIGIQNHTGLCGIKYDFEVACNTSTTVSFTLKGYLGVGTIQFGLKAGQNVEYANICGPVCTPPASCTPPPATLCGPPTTFTHTSIANGDWTSASTWQGGTIPTVENISNQRIKITHDVTVQNNNIKLDNNTIIYITGGGRLTLRNGNLELMDGNQATTEKLLIDNGSLRTSGNVQQSGSATVLCAINAKLEIGDEDATSTPAAFTSGFFSSSNNYTSANFQNTNGYRRLESSCLNVTHDLQNDGGTDIFINVCAEIGDQGPISGPHGNNGGFDGQDNGNIQIQSTVGTNSKYYDSEIYIPNGGLSNSRDFLTCNVDYRLTNGNYQNQSGGTLTGTANVIYLNHPSNGDIQNAGTWNWSTIEKWRTDNSNSPTGLSGTAVTESTQASILLEFGSCNCTSATLSLGNRVWYDTNNNGINDATENGIRNVTVNLYRDNNNDNVADGASIATLLTDINGNYTFSNLAPGNYIVGVVVPNGYVSSSINGGDPDNNTDLDDNGQVLVGNEMRGLAITLTVGGEPTSGNTNNTYDFGLLPDCACVNSASNLLENPSFENGTTGWSWNSSNGSLTTGTGYIACGTKNGFNDQTSGTSRVWQDVNISAGSAVSFSAFAGTHTGGLSCSPTLSLIFLNASNGVTGQTNVTVTRDVDINNGQLEQYTLTGVAPAGTVKVRVQSSITCNTMKLDAFCLTVTCAITLDFVKTDVLCNGASTGSIDLTPTGGTAPYTYDWADVAGTSNTQDRTGLAIGTYTVTVTDVNGCNKQGSVTITQPTAIVLSTTQVNVLCFGAQTGSIDLTVTGGVAPYTYNWGAGQPTTQDRSGLAAGTYNVTVTDANGCTKTTSATITQADNIVLSTTQVNVLCFGSSTGSIDLTVTGGLAPYTYDWADVVGTSNTQDRAGLAVGTYDVTVTDANGCSKTTSATITQAANIVLSTTQVNVLCNGASTGSIDLTVAGGVAPFTYNWGVGQPTTQDRSGLAAGTYNVTVTDANGCSKTTSATITQPTEPSTIGDYVWVDTNANGIIDGGELPLQGVTVSLFVDANTDGIPDGASIATDVSDANGLYLFPNVCPGNYVVQFGALQGYVRTTQLNLVGNDANDSDADPTTGLTGTINISPNENDLSNDAGYYQQITLGNYVWDDRNNDGVQDAGEPGIANATVRLYADANGDNIPDGPEVATTSSNSNGLYTFTGLNPGKYIVGVVIPAGYVAGATTPTSATPDNDDNTDNNGVTIVAGELRSNFITLTSGGEPATDGDGINGNLTLDFGLRGLASLGDKVWRDDDKDGVQDAGEPGISGITVSLYNNTGSLVGATVTDAYGNYLFSNLSTGDYTVRFTLPANYTFTTSTGTSEADATNSDVSPVTGTTSTVNLSAGENQRNIDAGLIFNTPPAKANIGDRVWLDTDKDGIQDAGEPGVSGVTVTLYDNTGAIVATAVTDANGNYLFTDVAPGAGYTIGFTAPAGTVFSPKDATGDNTDSDADPVTGRTAPFTVVAGVTDLSFDAGVSPQTSNKATLGDRVWNDLNQNGIQDAGEPGLAGITVRLYAADGTTLLNTTTTDAFGNYIFTDLVPASYVVEFVKPAAYTSSPASAAGSTTSNDSDPNSATGKTAPIALAAGDRNTTVDAGMYLTTPPGTLKLGDRVWNDENRDGVQQTTEEGIAGITVTLYQNGPDGLPGTSDDVKIGTTSTDVNGSYLFTDLAASTGASTNYNVLFSNIPAGYSFTTQDQTANGGTDNTDSDPNVITGRTGSVNLTANNLTLDAGLVQGIPAGKGSIGDRVWYDMPGGTPGVQDPTETGAAGITVKLYKDANNDGVISGAELTPVATTITDALGNYMFGGLDAGNYQVGFSGLQAGYTIAAKDAGADDTKDSDGNTLGSSVAGNTAAAGTSYTGLFSLTQGEDNLTIDLGIVPPANTNSLGGDVWVDKNNDGVQTAGEPPMKGVMVTLYNNAGTPIATTVTDENGRYLFTGLPDGSYSVGFSNLPAGYNFTNQSVTNDATGSDANVVTGRTTTVVLGPGNRNDTSLDAGLVTTKAAIGNYVWFDADSDGVQDATEAGISGVTVTLTRPGFGLDGVAGNADDALPVATAITDAAGTYLFSNLTPGDYQLNFSTIPNNLVFTVQNAPGDNQNNTNSDANPTTGTTGLISLSAGESDFTIDAGVAPNLPGSVGDYVWNDLNGNGIQDAGEPGVAGVLVTLYDAANNPVGAAITDGSGKYLITNVPAGTGYYVIFSNLPVGGVFTTQTSNVTPGDPTFGSDPNPATGRTASFSVVAGQSLTTVDAGIQSNQMVLGNYVWDDQDNDGVQDAGEPAINGATVKLYADANGDNIPDGAAVATTATNASGLYTFTGLTPGKYIVGVTIPAGYTAGTTTPTSALPDNDNNTDNNGVTTVAGELRSNFITLVAGAEPAAGVDGDGTNGNLTLDFGLKGTGSIGDFVWKDLNSNGIQDPNEPGIPGATVTLTYPNGVTISTTTGPNGEYLFSNLAPGNYSVAFTTPAGGYISSPANQGGDDTKDSDPVAGGAVSVTLTPGQNNTTVDAGFIKLINISGNVWHDVNALDDNLVNNTGPLEVPPASVIPTGLRAYLVNATTGLVERVSFVNSATGTYSFLNVTPNTNYIVYLSEQIATIGNPPPPTTLPVGWNHTGQKLGVTAGSDGINDGILFVPVFSTDVINVNFGIRLQAGEVVIG